MDKIKKIFKSITKFIFGTNFAMLAFIGYSAKLLTHSPSFADAFVLAVIAALYGYDMYIKSKKPDPVRVNEEVQAQIHEIQRQIRASQMENNIKRSKKFF